MRVREYIEGPLRLIQEDGGGWTVSEDGVQLMGIYDSKQTAINATVFSDRERELLAAQICMNQDRAITQSDLDTYLES